MMEKEKENRKDSVNQISLEITEEYEDWRLDKCVSELMGEKLSRSAIQRFIKNGELTVNGKQVKNSYTVKQEDIVAFSLADPISTDILPEDIPLDILYEDRDLLIVNKPKGMVVHPAAGHDRGTLVNALMFHCADGLSGINGVLRPGIVHRIDKDTSGSIVVCKNDITHRGLAEQFKVHSITRKYYAICCGNIKEMEGTIDRWIGRHPVERKKMCITTPPDGRHAVTHYKVLEHLGKYSLVECTLETGRTHQIRVHMASIGHPILGDLVYGKQDYKGLGQMLHAGVLGFIHPVTGEYIQVEAPLPEVFTECLRKLKMS